jgi:hypothetical protein
MKRVHEMSPKQPPGAAHVANNDAQPATGDKELKASLPDLVELVEEALAAVNVTELAVAGRTVIGLEIPVRRGGDDEVNRRFDPAKLAGVAEDETVFRLEKR